MFCALWASITVLWLVIRNNLVAKIVDFNLNQLFNSLAENLITIIPYIGKIFLPINLSVLPHGPDTKLVYGIGCILLLISSFVLSKEKRLNVCFFAVCWFFIFLLPTLLFSEIQHEYRIYIPIIGCMLFVMEFDFIKKGLNIFDNLKSQWHYFILPYFYGIYVY